MFQYIDEISCLRKVVYASGHKLGYHLYRFALNIGNIISLYINVYKTYSLKDRSPFTSIFHREWGYVCIYTFETLALSPLLILQQNSIQGATWKTSVNHLAILIAKICHRHHKSIYRWIYVLLFSILRY